MLRLERRGVGRESHSRKRDHGVVVASVFLAFVLFSLFAWTRAAAAAQRLQPGRASCLALTIIARMIVMTITITVWVASVTADAPPSSAPPKDHCSRRVKKLAELDTSHERATSRGSVRHRNKRHAAALTDRVESHPTNRGRESWQFLSGTGSPV